MPTKEVPILLNIYVQRFCYVLIVFVQRNHEWYE